MSKSVISGAELAERLAKANATHARRSQEMRVVQNLIKGDLATMRRLISVSSVCGSAMDSESCARIPKSKLQEVLLDFIDMLMIGIPHADDFKPDELDGMDKLPPMWMCGGLGSRWIDLDARKYGLDFVRVAFYSKAEQPKLDKPYALQIMCEKGRK